MSHRRTYAPVLGTFLSLAALLCPAQEKEPDNPVDTAPPNIAENVRKLISTLSQIPSWEAERENMLNAVEKVFVSNEWNSEPDMFALDLIREMEQLPPTAFQQRFDTMVSALSDRYMLSEDQEQMMRRTITRESHGLFMKHSGRIMQYGLEAIQTRIAGEPFTPEQVKRWVELAEPVFLDARERVKVAADRFMNELDPEQQELLRRDMEADTRRAERVLQMAEGWKRGEWQAGDWGLDEDPIQTGAAGGATEAGAAQAAVDPRRTGDGSKAEKPGPNADGSSTGDAPADTEAAQPAPTDEPPVGETVERPAPSAPRTRHAAEGDNDPWAQYVRGFIARYSLDDTQQQRAWLTYTEARRHRDQVLSRGARRGADASAKREPAADPAGGSAALSNLDEKQKAAVDRMYEQFKRRLERLPTRDQRKAAAAAPEPGKSPAPREKP